MRRVIPWSVTIAFGAAAGIAGGFWGRRGEIVFFVAAAMLLLIGWGIMRYLEDRQLGILAERIVDLAELDPDAQDEVIDRLSPKDQKFVRRALSENATTPDSPKE